MPRKGHAGLRASPYATLEGIALKLAHTSLNSRQRCWRASLAGIALAITTTFAQAAPPCPPGALGTSRILDVDATTTPRVGRKQFPQTLPLTPKEVVLTFDDGPNPGSTGHVLDALARECVRATFFLIGQNALGHPELVRRERSEGHTIANHSFSHPLLDRIALPGAEAEIDRGFTAIETALYGKGSHVPVTPFFRFPGFASSPALLAHLAQHGIVVFGADLWASDWNRMTPAQELALVLGRIEANRGGIVLLHDTKAQTAAMLPDLLRALKGRGYSVVHVVPRAAAVMP